MGNRPGLVRWGPGPTALPGAPRKARTGTTLRPFIPSSSETRDALYLQKDPFLIGPRRGDLSPRFPHLPAGGQGVISTVHGGQSDLEYKPWPLVTPLRHHLRYKLNPLGKYRNSQ